MLPNQGFQLANFAENVLFKSYDVISLFDGYWQSLWITDMKIGMYNMNCFSNGESLTTLLTY